MKSYSIDANKWNPIVTVNKPIGNDIFSSKNSVMNESNFFLSMGWFISVLTEKKTHNVFKSDE